MPSGQRILLVVGGGIAAFKALDLIRRLREAGASVTPVLTRAAEEFVTPLSVSALAASKVYRHVFDLTDEAEMGHIELSRSADLVAVVPATANLMAKMAVGLADDLASTVLMATDKRVLIAPAMNVRMWEHPATRRNLARLRSDGVIVCGPAEGSMACGEFGFGRLAEVSDIVATIDAALAVGAAAGVRPSLGTATRGPGGDAGPRDGPGAARSSREARTAQGPPSGGDPAAEGVAASAEGRSVGGDGRGDADGATHGGAVRAGDGAGPPSEARPAAGDPAAGDLAVAGGPAAAADLAGAGGPAAAGGPLAGRRIVVTSGPTHEPIDPVRYLANRSSGAQGAAIARALVERGAAVAFVTGPAAVPPPEGVELHRVETAAEMMEAALAALPADAFVAAAAVADWAVEARGSKIKKGPGGPPALRLRENADVLATVARHARRPRLVVGFAAETEDVARHAALKRARKGCDWIVANDVSHGTGIMGGAENAVTLITEGGAEEWPRLPKAEVAALLADRIAEALGADAAPRAAPERGPVVGPLAGIGARVAEGAPETPRPAASRADG